MSALIFRLRNVPDEEAEAVRDLLTQNNIDWYETSAGNWGIAMPGIWVTDDQQIEQARRIINNYQQQLSSSQRDLYEEQKKTGQAPTLIQHLMEHPLRSLGILAFCLFIVYVMVNPFLQLVNYSG